MDKQIQDLLEKKEMALSKACDEYIKMGVEFQEAEEKIKLIKAKVLNMDRVLNLPNQALRDAETDTILQNNEQIEPVYRDYLEKKLKSKEAWVRWEFAKEAMQNARTLVNNLTFGKVDIS